MRPLTREAGIPLGLSALAMALALVQRPGSTVADTKIDLHVDAARFLSEVASAWTTSGGLGQVQAGQYAGYLFPMGPFHAAGHGLGLPPWLVQRLWLGLLLALAAWGVVRLMDALLERDRGVAHLVAGALVVLNPFVVTFSNRTTVTLLGYAALPWLLLAVHRGLRVPRGWWWPGAVALLVTATGGGVNAAVTAWVLVGPVLLALFEMAFAGVRPRDVAAFAGRAALVALPINLWWIVPALVHARYGINFLPFTEAVGSIWDTTSLSESLRLMGYWVSYAGVGYGDRLIPYFDISGTMLFSPLPLVASLVVPALVLAGFVWTRRLRYGPFFLLLVLVGLLVMSVGWPEGTPLRRALTFGYYEVQPAQFLRTTYKAGPLVAIGLACLGGAAAGELWSRLHGAGTRLAVGAGMVLLIAGAAWPLLQGSAPDARLSFDEVPESWRAVGHDLDEELPSNSRALVLPGQAFAYYRWGATVDPVLPALTRRPVAVRNAVPYADLHALDLSTTLDSLLQGRTAVPGQLGALARLTGARSVVTATDDDRRLSGALDPAAADAALRRERGFAAPARSYGRTRRVGGDPGDLEPPARLPELRRYDLPGARGLVRVEPRGPATVVDGSAEALAGLAAFGALPRERPIEYAGDRSARELRRAAAAGAELVVSDSNRRRIFVSSRTRQAVGPTLQADSDPPDDAALLDPFDSGPDAQTVAELEGARSLRSPYLPSFSQFPEHRPYAAFDGDPRTFWVADRNLERPRRWIEIEFDAPRDVPVIHLLTQRESGTDVVQVEVAGRSFPVRPGWNRLRVGARRVGRLRVLLEAVRGIDGKEHSPGALAEIRVPGVRVRERLRPPRLIERALAGRDLSGAGLTYLFSRTSGDHPYRRAPRLDSQRGFLPEERNQEAALAAEPGDGERTLQRTLSPPAAREFRADAWISATPDARDPLLDRAAGYRGAIAFSSSGRFRGIPAHRASSAFDGRRDTAWIAHPGGRQWIGWRTRRPFTLTRLAVESSRHATSFPTALRVRWPRGVTEPLPVSPAGEVDMPRPVRARSFRLEVVSTLRRGRGMARTAAGLAEVRVPGLAPAVVPRSGPLRAPCGSVRVRVGGRRFDLRPSGDIADLDAGRPLRARNCGKAVRLLTGPQALVVAPGTFHVDLLRLRSPGRRPVAPAVGGGAVVNAGEQSPGRYEGVRVSATGPSWLVLGESYNKGWTARCEGRDLGDPEVVDGFANGWRIGAGCHRAELTFAPSDTMRWGFLVSAVAGALLLLFLLVRRRALPVPPRPVPVAAAGDAMRAWPLRRALVAGALVAVGAGFVFALRAGVVIGPAVALLLWRGAGPRFLLPVAGVLLGLVVPVLYLVLPIDDLGGFSSRYPIEAIAAHWVALGALGMVTLSLVQTLAARWKDGTGA